MAHQPPHRSDPDRTQSVDPRIATVPPPARARGRGPEHHGTVWSCGGGKRRLHAEGGATREESVRHALLWPVLRSFARGAAVGPRDRHGPVRVPAMDSLEPTEAGTERGDRQQDPSGFRPDRVPTELPHRLAVRL